MNLIESGAWWIGCGYEGTTRCCNIYTRRRRSGGIKFLVGRVRVPSTCLRNESDYIGNIDDKNDAFWLAQIYFMTQRYSRAEQLLTRPFPDTDDDNNDFEHPQTNVHTLASVGFTSMVPFLDNDRGKGHATDPFNSLPVCCPSHTNTSNASQPRRYDWKATHG